MSINISISLCFSLIFPISVFFVLFYHTYFFKSFVAVSFAHAQYLVAKPKPFPLDPECNLDLMSSLAKEPTLFHNNQLNHMQWQDIIDYSKNWSLKKHILRSHFCESLIHSLIFCKSNSWFNICRFSLEVKNMDFFSFIVHMLIKNCFAIYNHLQHSYYSIVPLEYWCTYTNLHRNDDHWIDVLKKLSWQFQIHLLVCLNSV